MKKVLSILLVIAMAATLFAGCSTESSPTPSTDPTTNPSASAAPTSNEPTKDPKTSWESPWKEGDELVKINVYDTTNYLAQWGNATQALLAEYGLKIGNIISPVLSDQIEINDYSLLNTSSGRSNYASAISNLFVASETAPDVLPALYALNTGSNAVFKTSVGKKNLVDLSPFIEEGGVLEDYVKWVWEGQNSSVEYWESIRAALETEDGALYALPRLEYMPTKELIHWNLDALDELNMEMPTTLEELETALAGWVNLGHHGFAFNPERISLETILTPIANMYGLDFTLTFDWTEMNGEPMFSYYYDEYLKVLQTVNKWAKNGWVLESEENAGHIAMCGDLTWDTYFDTHESRPYKAAAAYANQSLCIYGEAWVGYNLGSKKQWQEKAISASGYQAALSGGTALDYCYFAVSNRTVTSNTEEGYATVLKILTYMNSTMNQTAYLRAQFGREGIPFASTWEESGEFVYVTHDNGNTYIRFTDGNDRFNMRSEDETLPDWQKGKSFFRKLHPLYTWLFDKCNGFKDGDGAWRKQYGFKQSAGDVELVQNEDGTFDYSVYDFTMDSWVTPGEGTDKDGNVIEGISEWQYYANLASAAPEYVTEIDEDGNEVQVNVGGYGITDFTYGEYVEGETKYWARGGKSGGIDWFADVSAFPMQYTIYFFKESQNDNYPRMDAVREELGYDGTNTIIYKGFFPTPSEVLSGSDAEDMNIMVESVRQIAKDFTIAYLSGTKTDSNWTDYIKSLTAAGIEEVYNFYAETAYTFNTQHKDGTKSMSDVIAARKN